MLNLCRQQHLGVRWLAWLDWAVDLWFTNHRFMGEHDPLLDDLRDTSRFAALLERAREKGAGLKV